MKLQVMNAKSESVNSGCFSGNATAEFVQTSSGVGVKYLFQSYQQQLDPTNKSANANNSGVCGQHFAMSNEEARRLKGKGNDEEELLTLKR